MKLVQELFPRTIVMDDGNIVADGLTMEIGDIGERRVVDCAWVGEAVADETHIKKSYEPMVLRLSFFMHLQSSLP